MNRYFKIPSTLLAAAALFFSFIQSGQAAEGDSTFVRVHDATDIVWWGGYDQMGEFPDGSTSYNKILLDFTLGCASGGCSDWDYTAQVQLRYPVPGDTGGLVKNFELGRAITPYGGYMADGANGFDNSWERTFTYDITDFAQYLSDSVEVRVFYGGWSAGFSATLDFIFIEGTPPREVLQHEQFYYSGPGGWGYDNGGTMINADVLVPVSFANTIDAESARLRVTPSGHGFDNNVNCAEFCQRNYRIEIDGVEQFSHNMWRDDCGLNPVFPQGGTWLYDRANWCPGSEAWTIFHELDAAFFPGSVQEFELLIDGYSWSGTQTPNYIMDVEYFTYGAFNYTNEVELFDIIRPTDKYAHSRRNPVCSNPEVVIKNNGSEALTSCMITYGIPGGQICYYNWSGSLPFGKSESILLPNFNWTGIDLGNPQFFARVSDPNGALDEVAYNNEIITSVAVPELHPEQFRIFYKANLYPAEHDWKIYDDLGNVLYSMGSGITANSINYDTIDLQTGCYLFHFTDIGKDGLSWWANSDGNGSIRFLGTGGGTTVVQTFQADFGTDIYHEFTVGLPLGNVNSAEACDVTAIAPQPAYAGWLDVWPVPSTGLVNIDAFVPNSNSLTLEIYDLTGRKVFNQKAGPEGFMGQQLQLSDLGSGIFVLNLRSENSVISRKIILH